MKTATRAMHASQTRTVTATRPPSAEKSCSCEGTLAVSVFESLLEDPAEDDVALMAPADYVEVPFASR